MWYHRCVLVGGAAITTAMRLTRASRRDASEGAIRKEQQSNEGVGDEEAWSLTVFVLFRIKQCIHRVLVVSNVPLG